MKTLKISIFLLACTGSACTMDNAHADSPVDETTAAVPLFEHKAQATTLDTHGTSLALVPYKHEAPRTTLHRTTDLSRIEKSIFKKGLRFSCTDLLQAFWRGIVQDHVSLSRMKQESIFTSGTIRVEAPYLRSEILRHIPNLVSLQDRTAFEHYLGELTPEELCLLVCALGYFDVPQAYAWTHAYFVGQLINNRTFFEQSLPNIENLKMALTTTKHLSESLSLLKIIRLKNNLLTTGSLTGYDPILSPDGTLLATSPFGLETVYRTVDGKALGRPIGGNCCYFTADGSLLAVSQGISQETTLYHSHDLTQAGTTIPEVFWGCSPDGTLLTTMSGDLQETHNLYRTSDQTKLASLINHKWTIGGSYTVFNPDNSLVVMCNGEDVWLYHVNDATKFILTTKGHYAEFSPRGQLLAISTGDGGKIVVYNTNDLTMAVATLAGYEGIFSPDGSLLAATVDQGSKINIYRTSDLTQCIATFTGNRCLFSPDGKLLAVGQIDKSQDPKEVNLYDTHNWTQIGNSMPGALPRSYEILRTAERAFSPDGSLLVLAMGNLNAPCSRKSIYCTHDGSLLIDNRHHSQVGSNDFDCVVAYYKDSGKLNDIEFKHTLTMTTDEYLLTFAAIHQESEIDETFWHAIFDQAQPQVQKFVREKTGKFVS